MSDPLLWLLLLTLAVVFVARRGRGADQEARKARAKLAYQRLEGRMISLQATVGSRSGIAPSAWSPISLEDMPQEERRRLVLHIAVDTARMHLQQVERLIWTLASAVQERAAAHAVVVEAFSRGEEAEDADEGDAEEGEAPVARLSRMPGTGLMRLVFAPDGRGWSGEERVIAALDGSETELETLSLAQIHRKLLATLDEPGDAE